MERPEWWKALQEVKKWSVRAETLKATKLPDGPVGKALEPGEYQHVWVTQEEILQSLPPHWQRWVFPPRYGRLGVLTEHTVAEDEAGAWIVNPSVLQIDGWHGWLAAGHWIEYHRYIRAGIRELPNNLWVEERRPFGAHSLFNPMYGDPDEGLIVIDQSQACRLPRGPVVGVYMSIENDENIVFEAREIPQWNSSIEP